MSHFCSLYSTQILALQSLCLWARCSHGFIKLKLSFFLYKIWIWFLELLNTLSKRVFFTGFDSSQCHFYRIWKMILLKFKSKLVFFLRRKKKKRYKELFYKNWTVFQELLDTPFKTEFFKSFNESQDHFHTD